MARTKAADTDADYLPGGRDQTAKGARRGRAVAAGAEADGAPKGRAANNKRGAGAPVSPAFAPLSLPGLGGQTGLPRQASSLLGSRSLGAAPQQLLPTGRDGTPTLDGLKQLAETELQRLGGLIDKVYKDQGAESRVHGKAEEHFKAVNDSVDASRTAMDQAKASHEAVRAEVRAAKEDLGSAAHHSREVQEAVASVLQACNGELDRLRKKFKVA